MRPKNLKFPLTWEERKPLFFQGVFVVPQYYEAHNQWIDEEGLFLNKAPFAIEYCSGNGDWIIQKALEAPSKQWIAVEKRFERVRKIWSKMHNANIQNLTIVCGEALTFSRYYLPQDSVKEVFVNFPDPWPKLRHAKHRLIQTPFSEQLARIVCPKGQVTFVTDHPAYCQQMIEVMMHNTPYWHPHYEAPHYVHKKEGYGGSWFNALWNQLGREIFYMQFEKKR